ncbi:MAG: hypothetical protein N3A53_01910 [Verrucomicrobiae bacterium]|nr:hypothetical protein [Verrucomicrobiae bacterium]
MSDGEKVSASFEIAPFQRDSTRHLLVPEEANRLVSGHNRVHRLEIVRGGSDAVFVSDDKITLQLKRSDAGPGATNNFYRGEYHAGKLTTFLSGEDFVVGHIVRVSPTNSYSTNVLGASGALPGVYVCAKDNPGATDYPRHPLQSGGETEYWHWLATWPYQTVVCDDEGEHDFAVDGQEISTGE